MDIITQIHWASLAQIVGIDIMLGVDNAIVIALACSGIHDTQLRNRSILLGTGGAILLRAALLAIAGLLLALPYLKLAAGAYLLYIGYQLLTSQDDSHEITPACQVMQAVKTIIIADFMMSLDNVLGVAAAAQETGAHATAYAIAGIALSIPIIIYGARGLAAMMDRFPVITWIGGGLLGWVGAEMIITDPAIHVAEHLPYTLSGAAAVIGAALWSSGRKPAGEAA